MSKQRKSSSSKKPKTNARADEFPTSSSAQELELNPTLPTSVATDKTTSALRLLLFFFFLFFWGVRYRNFLFVAQEYDLFLWNWSYLREASERVAGLSRYASSFFIQFFYFPFLGALILGCCLSFIQYGTEKLFNLTRSRLFLSFIPPCLATIQTTSVNYFLFERADVAYVFSPIFNCAFALAFALIYSSLRSRKNRAAFFVVGLALAYPVFGFWALLSGVFCVLRETELSKDAFVARKKTDKRAFVEIKSVSELCELLFLYVLLVPCFYWFVFAETSPSFRYTYLAGLCEESVLTEGRELSTTVLWIFYQTTTILFLCACSLLRAFREKIRFFGKTKVKTPSSNKRLQRIAVVAPIFLCVLICAASVRFSYSSSNFQTLLKTARALDSRDWDALLQAESKVKNPIDPLIFARLTALTRTDQIAEKLFTRTLIPKTSPQLDAVDAFGMCGDRFLCELGAVNLAARTATNNAFVKRYRSAWALKTLVLCSLADQQAPLVARYAHLLQKTLFHRRFADEALACLQKSGDASSVFCAYLSAPSKADVKRAENLEASVETIRRLEPLEDDLASADNLNECYFRHIQLDDLSKREPNDRENRLATLLIMRNFPRFGEFFDAYLQEKADAPLPRSLQEAALFRERYPAPFETPENENKPRTVPTAQNVAPENRERFERFLDLFNSSDSNENDVKLIQEYGDTFWLFAVSKQMAELY